MDRILHVNEVEKSRALEFDTSPEIQKLVRQYSDVFQPGLGHCTKFKVTLSLKTGAQPKFFKPRPLPFALRATTEADLERPIRNGSLKPVEYSTWATPIMVVSKPNKTVRICGVYRVTVNPQLKINQYPLPHPNELFAALNGGEKFTKIDMSEAYLQLELDEESQNLVVINTHKGLFCSTRLPFGIASAPGVFQQTIDTML